MKRIIEGGCYFVFVYYRVVVGNKWRDEWRILFVIFEWFIVREVLMNF